VTLHRLLEHREFGEVVDAAVEQSRGLERVAIVALVRAHPQKARHLARPGAHPMKVYPFRNRSMSILRVLIATAHVESQKRRGCP
jgi:hypothetical protein